MEQISILMLEDSVLDAELIRARLDREGVSHKADRVVEEAGFREALIHRQYDLVLSDFSLPNFSGSQALAIVMEVNPDLPFIFVSGALGEEVAIETLKHGACDYVLKHRLERLTPAIHRALQQAEDVRLRRTAELALQQSETRYRLLAEATPNFVWAYDGEGKLVFVNQQFSSYTGMSRDELQSGDWSKGIHPDDFLHFRELWEAALLSGEGFEIEMRARRDSDGSYRWHLARTTPLADESGYVWQWLGTASEIEAQKQSEQSLRRSNDELQQFAFAASHDLQEPLRNISTFTQLLSKRYQGKLDSEADEYIGYAVEGAKRMNALIQDLLSYARVSMQEVPSQRVSMEQALRTVIDNLRMSVTESGAEITHDPLPEVTANAMQMFQLLQNLLSNAIKYRDKERTPHIHVSATSAPGEWIFSVEDNGQGFDSAYADRIFGVFHRLHGRDVPGTGIGLSICKRIIERHGGHIWVKSKPSEGTTFYFKLPALRV